MISRIGNHIYAKNADLAVKFYKDAFRLEEKGEPWRDDEGLIIHQNLYRNTGEYFLSVSDYRHLPNDDFIKKFDTDSYLTMLFFVFFSNDNDMLKTVEILSEDAKLVREVEAETSNLSELVCEVVDKFGVFWHLRVPHDESIVTDL